MIADLATRAFFAGRLSRRRSERSISPRLMYSALVDFCRAYPRQPRAPIGARTRTAGIMTTRYR